MAIQKLDEEAIFNVARKIESPDRRRNYLEQVCGADAALHLRVQALLQVHDEDRSFLQAPASSPLVTTAKEPIREGPGTLIGPYKLLQQIGEGGMGTVFMAEQTQPVHRKVALKVIKPGMDSRQVIARFEAERQALAMMDHVNIARVLDVGATESGRPYFVMELVHGVSITQYCDDNCLTPRERLELFVPVCQAIQHAHQKGIIHRDVKPSNVMITLYDGKPVPKVIDFGVAKAIEQKLTERTLFTHYGTMVGTLEYMSPEQAETSAVGADTRSDIYSLGVLLYELLTGSTPLSHKRVKEAAYAEILRRIKEEEPPRPSTRLSDSGEALASISAQRHMEPAKLTKLVRGELDWIVMKCLEKDRNRRYESATGFMHDIQRYLADAPVEAYPPSMTYRLRKFARKNKKLLITAAAFVALLVIGVVVSTWQAATIRVSLDETRQAKADTERALKDSEAAREQAEAVSEYLISAFRKPDPNLDGRTLKVIEVLGQAEKQLAVDAGIAPPARAALLNALGQTYLGLGLPQDAVRVFEKAWTLRREHLGAEHRDTLSSMNNLAAAYKSSGRLSDALPLYEETVKLMKAKLGPDHSDTLSSMSNLAQGYVATGQLSDALPLYEETLKLWKGRYGADHPGTLIIRNNLAEAYRAAGRLSEAITLDEETLKFRKANLEPGHPNTVASMNNLATGYYAANRLGDALPLFEEALKLTRDRLGPDHPDTSVAMGNLAAAYLKAGRLIDAVPLFEATLKLTKLKLGPDHPRTLVSMSNLAEVYRQAGRLSDALPLFEETLKLCKAKLGPDHPGTLITMNNLALAYHAAGRLDQATPIFEETLKLRKAKLGPDHPDTLTSMNHLALAYDAAGKVDQALPLLEETVKRRKTKLGAEHPNTLGSMADLGLAMLKVRKYTEAEPLLRECLAIRQQKRPDDWATFNTKSLLGGSLLGQKNYADAEPLLVAGYEGIHQRETKIPVPKRIRLREALERLVHLYDATGQKEKAAVWRKKLEARAEADQKAEQPKEK